MRPSSNSSQTGRFSAVQNLFGLLAAVMVLFGQSAAVGAAQGTGGAWIEVCAGSGTKMVQLDGEMPANDCAHCDYCTVQFSTASAGAPSFLFIGRAQGVASVLHAYGSAVFVVKAEQYWAANRGPPLISEVNMTINTAQWAAVNPPANWGASWL